MSNLYELAELNRELEVLYERLEHFQAERNIEFINFVEQDICKVESELAKLAEEEAEEDNEEYEE